MNAKDNFAQAMKDLLNGEGDAGAAGAAQDKKPAPTSFSSFSQPESRPAAAPGAQEKKDEKPAADKPAEAPKAQAPRAQQPAPNAAAQPAPSTPPASAPAQPAFAVQPAPPVSGEVSVITAGTTIVGDLTTGGGLRMSGDIKGNTRVAGEMELAGKVIGDIEAGSLKVTASAIKGDVTSAGTLEMDDTTVVVGSVQGKEAVLNSKIKGNLTVEGKVHFQPKAVLVGNLIAGTITIDEGAMLKGDIAITNAQTEDISVEEPVFDIEID